MKSWFIEFLPEAEKDLAKLGREVRRLILIFNGDKFI